MNPLLKHLPAPPVDKIGWPWTEETPISHYDSRKKWPRITIVTPSFNQGEYLEETLRSVLLQNYPNLQYIVCDGGSSDNSVAILEQYAPWLNHWCSESDRGQSHAINKGLKRADGYWFNWINSDDCLLPDALATVGSLSQDTLIISGAETTGATLADARPLGRTKFGPTLESSIVNHFVCQQGVFIRRSLIAELGGVREDLHLVMDLDLLTRALLRGGWGHVLEVDSTLAFFRQHAAAKTSTASTRFLQEERLLLASLGRAAGLPDYVLRYVSTDSTLPPYPESIDQLQPDQLADRLALRFRWDGCVEQAWQNRSWSVFREELRGWTSEHPHLYPPRLNRLRAMSYLPDVLLQVLSHLRSPRQDS